MIGFRVAHAALLACLLVSPAAAGVRWFDGSWDGALVRARVTRRPMIVLFCAHDCSPCLQLDSTLAAPEVVAYSNPFVCVRLYVETPEGKEQAKRMAAVGTPITIVLEPNGEERDRIIGAMGPVAFLKEMRRIRAGRETVADLLARLPAHEQDAEFNYRLGRKLSDRGDPRARMYLERTLALDSANASGKADHALMSIAASARGMQHFADGAEAMERLIRDYPASRLVSAAYSTLAGCYHDMGDDTRAVAALERQVAARPDDPGALNDLAWSCAEWNVSLDRALAAAEQAVQLSNSDPGVLDTLAEVCFVRGDFERAIQVEKQALEKQPDSPTLSGRLARFEAGAAKAKRRDRRP